MRESGFVSLCTLWDYAHPFKDKPGIQEVMWKFIIADFTILLVKVLIMWYAKFLLHVIMSFLDYGKEKVKARKNTEE